MAIKFIDLKNAYATIPREMTMGTLGWMWVPEAGVRMVERTYDGMRTRRAGCYVDRECQESPKQMLA